MLKRIFDPSKPYRFVAYGRMSDRSQNPRSPDQQFATIQETLQRCRYPWTCVKQYRDDGIKGRYVKRRLGLQEMLRDIRAGLVNVDLIAVDTWERFGRAEECEVIRHELRTRHGVLIVTADSRFSDPTGLAGKAVGMAESMRSTEEGRVKSHNVLRGKKDAIRRKRWPGGPPPFGFRLKQLVDSSGPVPRIHTVLEHDPVTIGIRRETLFKAHQTGWGGTRLAQWLNGREDIPETAKPFYASTVAEWLEDPLNIGTYVWGEFNTDIVNDARVIERNPDADEILREENFCEPVIEAALFEDLLAMKEARRKPPRADARDGAEHGGKLIKPMGRGISLVHCLSGLVVCGACGAAMIARGSGRRSKAGTSYIYRTCPRHNDGACDNAHHVREDDLQKATFDRLRARLLPSPAPLDQLPAWFPQLVGLIEIECERLRRGQPDRRAACQKQICELEEKLKGWAMTLADPNLPGSVRADIVALYDQTRRQKQQLADELSATQVLDELVQQVVDPRQVIERLHRLDEMLGCANPTLVNVELTRHISCIRCYPDGRVLLEGTNLGVFDGAIELLSDPHPGLASPAGANGCGGGAGAAGLPPVRPRRRSLRYVPEVGGDGAISDDDVQRALDPDRFAGLPPALIWQETFHIRPRQSWAEMHADDIYRQWRAEPNLAELARRHGKSVPTIRKARNIGRDRAAQDEARPPGS